MTAWMDPMTGPPRWPLARAGILTAALTACSTSHPPQEAPHSCDHRPKFELVITGSYGLQRPTPFVMLLPYIAPEHLRDQRRRFEIVATLPTEPLVGVAPGDLCATRSGPNGATLACLDDTGTARSIDMRSAIASLAHKYGEDPMCATVLDHIGSGDLVALSRAWHEDARGCRPSPKPQVAVNVTLRLEPAEVEHRSTITGADHTPRVNTRATQHVRLSLHAPALGLSRELGLLHPKDGCVVASFQGRPAAMCGAGKKWSPRQLVVYQSPTQLLFRTAFALDRRIDMNAVSLPCGHFASVALDASAMGTDDAGE